MSVRDGRPAELGLSSAPFWSMPGLIDEGQPSWIKIRLSLEPGAPALQDVRPLLLARVRGFFERDAATVEEAPDCRRHDAKAVVSLEPNRHL